MPALLATAGEARILLANEAFCRSTNRKVADIVGRTAEELPLWADPETERTLAEKIRTENRLTDEEVMLHVHDGALAACAASSVSVELGGERCTLLVAPRAPERARTRAEIAAAVAAALTDADTITARVLDHLARSAPAGHQGGAAPAVSALPARAREVLRLVSRGLDDASIAGQLGINQTTVRNHVNGLYRRLRVRSRAQLIVWARERGLGNGPG